MMQYRNFKFIYVIVVLISIIGLTLGYARLSKNLTTKIGLDLKLLEETSNVDFSILSDYVEVNGIKPVLSSSAIVATNATIDNTKKPTISDIEVTFTEPGQSVTYEFYSYNEGMYLAYLNSIIYENIANDTKPKVCTPKGVTTESLVDLACSDIVVSVKVGDEPTTTASVRQIENHTLKSNTSEAIKITISYVKKEEQVLLDGGFTVNFGNIILDYNSVD